MFPTLLDIDDNTKEYYPLTSDLIKEVLEITINDKIVICPIFKEEKYMNFFNYKKPYIISLVTCYDDNTILVDSKETYASINRNTIKIITDILDVINYSITDYFSPNDVDCLSLPTIKNSPDITSYIRENKYEIVCLEFKDKKSKAKFKLMK